VVLHTKAIIQAQVENTIRFMEENMFKKIFLPLIAAALLAVSFTGTVLAAEETPEGVRVRGEVIAVDAVAGKFRIEKNDGTVLTFFVNENTHFRGKAQSLEDLEVGWKVGVGAREDDDKLWAILVISGDPEDFIKARGRVTDVNKSAGKFTIEKPDGEKMTFFVDENTRYGGQAGALEDIQEGWHAGVVAKEDNPGKLVAVGVIAGDAPELIKVKGTVTAVDPVLGKFEIQTDDGRTMRFFVDEKTRYQGQLSSLDEMQVGWSAGVAAKETTEDGKLIAVLVIAGTRPEVVRVQGTIIGVDELAGKFRLENPDGRVFTFFVDENTTYRGQVAGIADLKEGMRAGVGAIEDAGGDFIAKVVVAGFPENERPEIIKAQGSIKTVNPGAGKFQLEKSDGTVLTVYVDGKTNYRGQVASFDDLEKGMRAGIAGYIDEEGKIIARYVIAGFPRQDRPEGERPRPEALQRDDLTPGQDL
jgi:hypothetical protein